MIFISAALVIIAALAYKAFGDWLVYKNADLEHGTAINAFDLANDAMAAIQTQAEEIKALRTDVSRLSSREALGAGFKKL